MIMKKKALAMLMASVMVFSLTACGGSAETVAEETQQEEIVEESSTKEETKQEETVVETSPKEEVVEENQEVEKVEEPADDGAPVQPISRIAHIAQGGISGDVTETLEYNADGYTVKGRVDSQQEGSSCDYEFSYNSKGEVIHVKNAYYSELTPNGFINEMELVQGYPISATNNENVAYNEYSGFSTTQSGIVVADGNYVDFGYTLVDSNGNLLGSCMNNVAYIVYQAPLGMFDFGMCNFPKPLIRIDMNESVDNYKLSASVEGNKTFVTGSRTEEAYDAEQRENVNKETYSFIDIISYGDNGLVESIETYEAPLGGGDFSLENIVNGKLEGYAHYKYDSQGNVVECKTRESNGITETVITYDYSNGTQTVSDSEDTTSDSSAASIEGRWRCRSENYPYDVIYFAADGTGNLYKGIDAYPLKYTFDGTKAYVTADGQEFTFYVYLDENLMVEGESDAPYDKEQ